MKKITGIILATIMLSLLIAGCNTDGSNTSGDTISGNVTLNGSTSVDRVINMLKEAFEEMHTAVNIQYNPTGSGGGIEAAAAGTVDIGLSSRELRATETGVTGRVFAIDGLAIIVHPTNPVTNLSSEQIAQIYTGVITNWSEVGGNDAPIAVIGRDSASGSRAAFEEILGIADETKHAEEHASGGSVITSVAGNEGAIGYTSLSSVDATVKAISVDNIAISEATLLNKTYPIARPFILVLNDDVTLSPQAQAFVDFIMSTDATAIISAAGVLQASLN
ncbi:MAG: phosphate ABC transporter substrate-binding protein [Oscillospiraceae bacterium]|jgi:phosphate transport system substrate-binding protein|nr:phosphate ABC transporter substrate-binding protein [Oscillospiraceae bacterium]